MAHFQITLTDEQLKAFLSGKGGMKTLVEPDPGCPDKAGCMGALPSMCKGNGGKGRQSAAMPGRGIDRCHGAL